MGVESALPPVLQDQKKPGLNRVNAAIEAIKKYLQQSKALLESFGLHAHPLRMSLRYVNARPTLRELRLVSRKKRVNYFS